MIRKKYRRKFLYFDIHYYFLVGSVYMIPIVKVLKNFNLSENKIAEILEALTNRFVENIPSTIISFVYKCMNSFLGKLGIIVFQFNFLTNFNKYQFKYKYKKENGYYMGYDYTKCGICTLYKEENIYEYVKHICSLDINMFDKIGFTLTKSKLLSENDEICNFRLVKKI